MEIKMETISTLHPQYIKNSDGESSFVVLAANEYEALLEDLQDLAAIAERRNETTISIDELEESLKLNNYVHAWNYKFC